MANVTVNGTPYTGVDEVRLPITNGGETEQRFVLPPSGSETLTENDTYDVSDLAEVVVDVPTGSDPVINPLSVTENGTYTAPSGVDGYSPVTVNVQVGGGDVNHFSKQITVASDLSGGAVFDLIPNAELISEGITVNGKKIQDMWANFIIILRRVNATEGTQEYVWGITMSDTLATTSVSNNPLRRYAMLHASSSINVALEADRNDITNSGIFVSSTLSRGIFVNAGGGYTIKAGSYEVHILYWGAIEA